MLKVLVQKHASSERPWVLFQRLARRSPSFFLLDSIHYKTPDQRYSYFAADPFFEICLKGGRLAVSGAEKGIYPASELLSVLRRLFKKYRCPEAGHFGFFTGGAVGFWGYELAGLFDRIRFRPKPSPGTPDLYLGFYLTLAVYDHLKRVYYLVSHYDPSAAKGPLSRRVCRESLKAFAQTLRQPHPAESSTEPFCFKKFRAGLSRSRFEMIVRKAKAYIRAGDIYQANLSQRFLFEFKGSPFRLYEALRRINPSPFASMMACRDLKIISSSPERLVRKTGRHCETRPIAGTRPRRKGAERQSAKELLASEKERAEHIMLVDLERNDLGRVCDYRSVRTEELMKIEKYSHVLHIVSKITGRLEKSKDGFDLIRAMFPGGTITGCPKIRCMEIIDELEPVRRGIYTGSIGYVDLKGDLDLNIVIRTLVLQKDRGHLQVGAGIVHDSDPFREYEETLHKGEALAQALAEASLD